MVKKRRVKRFTWNECNKWIASIDQDVWYFLLPSKLFFPRVMSDNHRIRLKWCFEGCFCAFVCVWVWFTVYNVWICTCLLIILECSDCLMLLIWSFKLNLNSFHHTSSLSLVSRMSAKVDQYLNLYIYICLACARPCAKHSFLLVDCLPAPSFKAFQLVW